MSLGLLRCVRVLVTNWTWRHGLTAMLACAICSRPGPCEAGKLSVGAASISITPDERVALDGQFGTRISEKVDSPCIATAVAIETRKQDDQSIDQAIFVSCDLVVLRGGTQFYDEVRSALNGRLPEHLLPKIVLNATHTHTGPVAEEGLYQVPESGVMSPTEYRDFLMQQLADVIVQAWEARTPARVAWGLGHAVIAHNRRAVYDNGTASMYGKTNDPSFRGTEGTEDHGIELMYFWNSANEVIATVINVACPSQEVERRSTVNADFWHPVRESLREKHGQQLHVLAWTGAGGDQSPHLMFRKDAEARMQRLRGIDSLQDLANRIVAVWEDVYQLVQTERHDDIEFCHQIKTIQLPYRNITQLEAKAAKAAYERIQDTPRTWAHDWHLDVVTRFEQQQRSESAPFEMELHAVRIGDVAVVTNVFELFTDYGVQMKARSPALQTFVIQLCGGGTYLPTERAMSGGGYSAIPQSTPIGPEGGQVLVNETIALLDQIWKQTPPPAK
ncbi:hypothetical protein SH661x_002355 [Planctomicrobium sp. SH661]|uniref:hypothetical protein n=1 Tax=Planctomicrobium sp. SH661 TaxID=3448124 RepID=UPI003F5CBABF